ILGATGTVGQRFVSLLNDHPYFKINELLASERNSGRTYREACVWKQDHPMPDEIARMRLRQPEDPLESTLLFSGLDSSVAGEVERYYAERGHIIISNAKNFRMDEQVPLVIPEVNPDHFALLAAQEWAGAIVTNSNCSTMFLAMALAPLEETFGLEAVQVSTMQAISGAGYPGVPSLDILGNVVPYISGEEEKLEEETQKILGRLSGGAVEPASFVVSAQCNRVPVVDGHLETVSFSLRQKAGIEEVARVLASFRGLPQRLELPSAPNRPLIMMEEPDRPQPARDIGIERGMSTLIGRLRPCPVLDYRMVILGHNTIRGAAGAAVLNAEAMYRLGLLGDDPAAGIDTRELKERAARLRGVEELTASAI
ncbi:MAG TPA: aspartate-semialdehyde dehydrogenase, partial [Sediminispirochaeta sp.]|nr:aspartate-semialdehyde dehydrogenase [Sediminispirochaeta sp.]